MTWYVVNKLITDNYQEALKWARKAANETPKNVIKRKQKILHSNSVENAQEEHPSATDARRN